MLDQRNSRESDLFELVYEAALHPDKFSQLIAAWDASFLDVSGLETASLRLADLENKGLARHFERAGRIFAASEPIKLQSSHDFIAAQRTAAFLTTTDGRILLANEMSTEAFGVSVSDTLGDLPLEAQSTVSVQETLLSLSDDVPRQNKTVALSGIREDNQKIFILIIERLPANTLRDIRKPTLLVRSTLTRWDERIKSLLRAVFHLTPTELEILELLNDGLRSDEIAQRRERSPKTVRTQIKAIYQKTRTNSQSELLRHVSSLMLLAGEVSETIDAGQQRSTDYIEDTVSLSSSQELHFVDQGPRDHKHTAVCFFSTTPPLQNAPFENALSVAGIRRVATYKPGSGRSTSQQTPVPLAEQATHMESVVAHLELERIIALGHCSGGVSALYFAKNNPDKVSALVLIDTGAPLVREDQWEAMPDSAKRTFVLARTAPELLFTPHQVVAADFFSGDEGRRRIAEYFYADQGNDVALLSEAELFRLASGMIEYCLSNTEQLIEDVRGWTQDWSRLLADVSANVPVYFIHGSQNLQFPIRDLHSIAQSNPNVHVVEAKGAAQLTLFTHGDVIQEVISRCC